MGNRRNFLMSANGLGNPQDLIADVADIENSKHPYCVRGNVGNAIYTLELFVLGRKKMIDASLKHGDTEEKYIWSPK